MHPKLSKVSIMSLFGVSTIFSILANLQYWLVRIMFEFIFGITTILKRFLNGHYVLIFIDINLWKGEAVCHSNVVIVYSWERHRSFALTGNVFSSQLWSERRIPQCSLLFLIVTAEQFVYALIMLLTSALISSPVHFSLIVGDPTPLVKSGVRPSFQKDVHIFLCYVGLFFILQNTQFDYAQACLAYWQVSWDDEGYFGMLLYVSSGGKLWKIMPYEGPSAKRDGYNK